MTKKRISRERQRNRRQECDRQRLYGVLNSLGLLKYLDGEKWFKRRMLEFPFRDPVLKVATGLEEKARPLIDDYLSNTFRGMEFREFIRYAMPFLRTVEVNFPEGETRRTCRSLDEEFQEVELEGFRDVYAKMLMHSSFTDGHVSVSREFGRNLVIEVVRMRPEVSKVRFLAGWREVYRVFGFQRGGGGIPGPLSAPRPGGSERRPVFMQGHAIRRLYERLDVDGLQTMLPTLVGTCLSAREPILYRGQYLVPLDMPKSCRLGYLVVVDADPGVVCVTFLFVTMDGTPEGDEFQRRMRFRRADTEYNGMDRLSTFTETDLSVDGRVRELVGDLGGLMDFAGTMRDLDDRTQKAGSLLSYLGVGVEV